MLNLLIAIDIVVSVVFVVGVLSAIKNYKIARTKALITELVNIACTEYIKEDDANLYVRTKLNSLGYKVETLEQIMINSAIIDYYHNKPIDNRLTSLLS